MLSAFRLIWRPWFTDLRAVRPAEVPTRLYPQCLWITLGETGGFSACSRRIVGPLSGMPGF